MRRPQRAASRPLHPARLGDLIVIKRTSSGRGPSSYEAGMVAHATTDGWATAYRRPDGVIQPMAFLQGRFTAKVLPADLVDVAGVLEAARTAGQPESLREVEDLARPFLRPSQASKQAGREAGA